MPARQDHGPRSRDYTKHKGFSPRLRKPGGSKFLCPGAGQVENNLGKALSLLGELLYRGRNVSADPADIVDAVKLRATLAAIDGLTIAFNRDDFSRRFASERVKFPAPESSSST